MPKYDQLIEQAQANVNTLGEKLKDLDKLHQDIISLKTESESIPLAFEQNFQKISNLSKQYTETLGSAAKTYLDGSNSLFTTKLNDFAEKNIKLENEVSRLVNTDLTKSFNDLQIVFIEQTKKDLEIELIKIGEKTTEFQTKINDLQKEVNRLVNTDLTKSFNDLQKVFIEQTQKDLEIELIKIGEKTTEFQTKINDLQKEVNRLTNTDLTKSFNDLQKVFIEQTKKDLEIELIKIGEKTTEFQTKITSFGGEINRLEKVDLEKGFDKLQKTLSDIFSAINAINLTLTGLTTSLNSIIQSLGQIQKTVEDNFKETNKIITTFSTETNSHLNQQDKKNDIEFETLKNKVVNLSEQNIALKKEITTNRVIQIVGLVITISLLIYLIIKH